MVLIARVLALTPRPVWWVLAGLVVLGIAYTLGARDTARATKAKQLEEYNETLERIDRTLRNDGDAGAARGRLREAFGPWRGDL